MQGLNLLSELFQKCQLRRVEIQPVLQTAAVLCRLLSPENFGLYASRKIEIVFEPVLAARIDLGWEKLLHVKQLLRGVHLEQDSIFQSFGDLFIIGIEIFEVLRKALPM